MSPTTRGLGLEGEQLAERFLGRRGYRILEKNYRTRRGEIDVIARDGDTLVFVEVKARNNDAFGLPGWSVNRTKRLKLSRLARHYLNHHQLHNQACRFDLVFIKTCEGQIPRIELFQNAFDVEGEFPLC